MLNQDIQHWLTSGGSFAAGLLLHAQTGNGRNHKSLQQYLSFPFIPPVAHDQLAQDLRAYLVHHPVLVPIPTAPPVPATAPVEQPADPVEQRLRATGKALLKERDGHRAQLVQMVTEADKYSDKDRYLLCQAIMTVQEEIDATYQQLRTYREEGILEEPDTTKKHYREAVEKYQRIMSLRSSISRLRKRIKNPKDEVAKKADEQDVLAKQVELQQLEEELGLHD
ncbi:MAG: hypothetical protein AAFO02_00570 [Bacteroidota bacterium]